MTDNQIKARVRAVLGVTTTDSATSEHPVLPTGPLRPDNALQVLTLAQRTAEEHVAGANRHAEKIRVDAQAAADQSARDAQVHAHNVRVEADKVLADARAAAEQAARDARASSDEARRSGDQILAEARAQAEAIVGEAKGHAEQLRLQAQQRYEDSVGSLRAKREALQQQIEALGVFDREYRARLTSFMQGQLRHLWADQPQVGDELPAADDEQAGAVPDGEEAETATAAAKGD